MDYIEIAEVFRQFGSSYIDKFGKNMLPSHLRAIDDIMTCRTRAMGEHIKVCLTKICSTMISACKPCRDYSIWVFLHTEKILKMTS